MTIYIDIVLLENIVINFAILLATSMMAKIRGKIVPLLCSSVIGAIYAVVSYCFVFEFFHMMVMKIVLSVFMIWVAFKPKKRKSSCKTVAFVLFDFFLFCWCNFNGFKQLQS